MRSAHRDSGSVYEAFVEVVQGCLSFILRFVANEAEFPEPSILGVLQAAVSEGAKGTKELPEALLLHLGREGGQQEGTSATGRL